LFINTLIAQELEEVSLQLKWKYQFQFAGFIIAKEKGFYKDVGLEVELKEYNGNININKDVLSGKSTFGINDSSLILESMEGKPLVALMAILQESPNILMGLKSSGIKTLEDLNNKNLALYKDVSAMTVLSMLTANHINYKFNDVIFGIDKLISKDIDMSTAYITNEPFIAREKGLEIVTFNPKDYGFDSYGDILFTSQNKLKKDPEQVHNFYEASKKGWEYAFNNIDETVDIIYNKYNTLQKSKKALTYEANVLKKITNIENNFGNIDAKKIKSIANLLSFMINGKYDLKNLDSFIYKTNTKDIYLSKAEKAYLKSKESIKMCYNTSIKPYTMIENGQPIGVSVDYLREVEKKINKKFEFIYTDTIKEQFTMLYNKECLTLPIVQTSPQAVPFIKSTIPAGKDNLVLVTKKDEPYIFNMDKLKNKKIGIDKDFVHLATYLDKHYPQIEYIKVKGNALKQVKNGELFGAIGSSIMMNYELTKKYKDSLKVMTDYSNSYVEGSIGVHIDEPILLSILNKAIASMDDVTQDDVFDKWINVNYKEIIDYTLVWQIIFISSILISITLFWNRRLNSEMKKRKKVENQLFDLNKSLENKVKIEIEKNTKQQVILMQQSKLVQMGEMIENIAHQWRQPLAQINSSVLLIDTVLMKNKFINTQVEDKLLEIESLTEYMSKTIDDFKNFFHPNKQKTIFSIENAVNKSYDILKGAIKVHHIKTEIDISENLQCYSHLEELQQVILTILNNAIDALVNKAIKSPKISLKAYQKEKNIILEIQDNALGIDEKIIDKIFEPYFTTKHKSQGTGLGLYMAKMIIESGLEGSLCVKNISNGVCVSVHIPQGELTTFSKV
jgi:signal transduction histidine kinase/ABC-type nitrate/sulfonate/bicarbonate transport system substrate-binding protein